MIKGLALKQLQISLYGAEFMAAWRIAPAYRLAELDVMARAGRSCGAAQRHVARETDIPRFLTAKLRCNTLRAMRLRALPRRAGLAPFD